MSPIFAKTRICSECGANLSDSSPAAPCSACLMQLGLSAWNDRANPDPNRLRTMPHSAQFDARQSVGSGSENVEWSELRGLEQQFPHLEILHKVGQGGMGTVYCARQKSLDRLVALKVIKPDAQSKTDFADRFVREAKALAQLNHPNIVTVHDFGEQDDNYYFIMEYVDGINIRQMLQGQKLTPRQALEIVPAVCDALQYAHDKGIVHRDIKPENILVDTEGNVKIADFGLAKLLDRESSLRPLTQSHQVMGTMHYMAPEQIEKPLTVDHRADIYSLGVVIYELLTGELPLGRFAPPSKKVSVDIRLDEIVLHSLEKEPSLRYQRVSDVKSDVQNLASETNLMGQTPPAISPQLGRIPLPPIKSHPGIVSPGPIPNTGFWGVLTSGQSYRNLLYLLMSLPLGIMYFTVLISLLATGIGTLVVWVGIPVLLGTFLLSRAFTRLERKLAANLLNTNLKIVRPFYASQSQTMLERALGVFKDRATWRGMLYLAVKFPMGIASFVLLVTLICVPLSLMLAPIAIHLPGNAFTLNGYFINSIPAASLCAVIGLLLFVVSLHTLNGVAWLHAKWANYCLTRLQ